MAVIISNVKQGSLADKKKICADDILISVNGQKIEDFLDYQFYLSDVKLKLVVQTAKGKMRVISIRKGEYEDIGIEFADFLMDNQRSCKNKCIFCFIDQLPKGMRDTLYFKDDDSRLSFLFGNYITLTNLKQHDVDRIIKMHISPINISVHTTDPKLRCEMMKNKNAGDSLKYIEQIAAHGISINTQLVLCPNINDGEQLKKSLKDLSALFPSVQMVAAVPVGITKFRDGLAPLKSYTKAEAQSVIDIIEAFADDFFEKHGVHFAWAADEFYLKADRKIPNSEYYEDFAQLENGVGMSALLRDEFMSAIENVPPSIKKRNVTVATGCAAFDLIDCLTKELCKKVDGLSVNVQAIKNDFFGEEITVSGLVVGKDLIAQLENEPLGDELILPSNMLRSEGDVFLDDISVADVSEKLDIEVKIVYYNGAQELVDSLLNIKN